MDFNIDTWGAVNELPVTTINKLKDEEVVTADLLVSLTPDDMKDLGLTIGQRKLLQRAIASLPATPGQAAQAICQQIDVSEAAIRELMDKVKRDAEALKEMLCNAADKLDYHFANVQTARKVASSAAVLGQILAITAQVASPFVRGAFVYQQPHTTGPDYCSSMIQAGQATAQIGRGASKGASAVGAIIEKTVLEQMQAQWRGFQVKFQQRNEMVQILLNERSSIEDETFSRLDALPAVVQMSANNLMAIERPSALTEVLQILGEEMKGNLQVMTLDAVGSSQANGMINLMVQEDIHDIIDSSIKLSLNIKCPAGEPLRLLADALEMMGSLDLLSARN